MVKNNLCNICKSQTSKVFSFGEIYISNFIKKEEKSSDFPKSDLTLYYCRRCRSAQLGENIDPDVLYKKKYWYYSGINQTMKNALKDVVDSICDKIRYGEGDIWLDIACNDGTLLSNVPAQFETIGIDPADRDIIRLARQKVDYVINDYFSKEAYFGRVDKKAKVITCIAMFYDLKDPIPFVHDVKECLDDDGLFVLQMSYTPLMIEQTEFGNVCAEHVMYHSITSIKNILDVCGFEVVDVDLNDINGGSFRVYATKNGCSSFYGNKQQRDVGYIKTLGMLSYENWHFERDDFTCFMNQIYDLKKSTLEFVKQAVAEGKKVYAYGASTKGNMLLQFFGLNNTLISKVADRNSEKWELKTIGTEIPICSEEEMRQDHPDYLLILPWYFSSEFKQREEEYLKTGGKFILPCPEFSIEGYDE